jgi:hypothetical protein
VPANLPSATGAAGSRLLGSLTLGATAEAKQQAHWFDMTMALERITHRVA